MILSGDRIRREVKRGRIVIEPFNEDQINPNSYNYRLGEHLLRADGNERWVIGPEGFVLMPGEVYLGHTVERIGSAYHTPSLIGRSSVGRLGLFVQVDADLGQVGAVHSWTLELKPTLPIRVFAHMRIGQVSFWATQSRGRPYAGVYARYDLPQYNLRELRT